MTTFTTVDEYIAAQPSQVQPRLHELRAVIRAAVPDAQELISYGMPTYRRGGSRVHFAAAKTHCALYGGAIDAVTDELRGYRTIKGTVQFPLDQPVPKDLVRKLVTKKFA
jgi:uncharacterized protein YdhG (YjbR/CyaY superfamily)